MRSGPRHALRRLGVVGTVVYPPVLGTQSGDVRTWAGLARHFDEIVVIAQTEGRRFRRQRVGSVRYVLIPRLPRPADVVWFPLAAFAIAAAHRIGGLRVWAVSDPLRSGLVALALQLVPRTRVVVHVQGQLLRLPGPRFGARRRLVEALARFVARRAHALRVVSREIADEARAAGVAPERIAVIPSRCDTAFFDPDRWTDAAARLRADLTDGDPGVALVGFLGSLNPSKGVDVLLAAARTVHAGAPVRLVVAGDGPLLGDVLAAAAQGAPPISAVGRLGFDQVPAFLGAVDVLLQPSYDEGLPRSVLEAMSMPCAVVSTAVLGNP